MIFSLAMLPLSLSQQFDLPVLPNLNLLSKSVTNVHAFPILHRAESPYFHAINSTTFDTSIPKIFWTTMKNRSTVPSYMKEYLDSHKNWTSCIVDDFYMTSFMEEVFANTSVLWAYNTMNPNIMVAKADIWRYAVLYVFGGMYIDADSSFKGNVDEFLTIKDKFILSTERNDAHKCYNSDYKLYMNPKNTNALYGRKSLIQWLIISSPRHPFIIRTLVNMVDIVKNEYLKTSVMSTTVKNHKTFLTLICSTGPGVFTASVNEVLMSHENNDTFDEDLGSRFAGVDFKPIGGIFKRDFSWNKKQKNYYVHFMNNGGKLLGNYTTSDLSDTT